MNTDPFISLIPSLIDFRRFSFFGILIIDISKARRGHFCIIVPISLLTRRKELSMDNFLSIFSLSLPTGIQSTEYDCLGKQNHISPTLFQLLLLYFILILSPAPIECYYSPSLVTLHGQTVLHPQSKMKQHSVITINSLKEEHSQQDEILSFLLFLNSAIFHMFWIQSQNLLKINLVSVEMDMEEFKEQPSEQVVKYQKH